MGREVALYKSKFGELTVSSSTYVYLAGNTIVAGYKKTASNCLIVIEKGLEAARSRIFHTSTGYITIPSCASQIRASSCSEELLLLLRLCIPAMLLRVSRLRVQVMCRFQNHSTLHPSGATHLILRIFETEKGGQAEAHTPPYNPAYKAPTGTLPLPIVSVHDGPTIHISQTINIVTQYWSSRGTQ